MSHPVQQTGFHYGTFKILGIATMAVAAVCILTGWVVSFLKFRKEMKAMKGVK